MSRSKTLKSSRQIALYNKSVFAECAEIWPEPNFTFIAPLFPVCYNQNQERTLRRGSAPQLQNRGENNGSIDCLLYRLPVSGGHQSDGKAASAVPGGWHQEHRHGRQVCGHQDALWGAGQPGVPAPQLRQGGGGPVQGAGRPPVPDRLQHPLPGQPQKRAGAPDLRPDQRLLAHDHGLPDPDRRRPARHR